jgi:glycosyltransferase involved in cell wall biosynthesis
MKLKKELQAGLSIFEKKSNTWVSPPSVAVIITINDNSTNATPCLISVLCSAESFPFLIIINDKTNFNSSVSDIRDIIIESSNKNIFFVHLNKQTEHYANSNKLKSLISNKDIIFLEPNNIVTTGWVERLHATAKSNKLIGTVIPWSNSGENRICSDNLWFENFLTSTSIERIQDFLQLDKTPSPPRLLQVFGSCVFINNDCLNEIGLLPDYKAAHTAETIVAWSMRAAEHGFIHVLAQDTFVYKKHDVHFINTTDRKETKNQIRCYLEYSFAEKILTQNDPLTICRNYSMLRIMRGLSLDKPSILIMTHNKGGGSLKATEHFIESQKKHYIIHILRYSNDDSILTVMSIINGTNEFPVISIKMPPFTFKSYMLNPVQPEHIEIYTHIMRIFNVSLLYVNHTISTGNAAIFSAYALNVPILLIAHDFLLLHPNYVLANKKGELLTDDYSKENNKRWFAENTNCTSEILQGWTRIRKEILNRVNHIIFPSEFAQKLFCSYAKELNINKTTVIEHSVFDAPPIPDNSKANDISTEPLRVLYLGIFSEMKGGKIFSQCAELCSKSENIQFLQLGSRQDKLQSRAITHLGNYTQEDVILKISKSRAHLVCILSICPETFCYTLTEAWLAGVPVVVTPIGAIMDRVSKQGGGWILDSPSPQNLLQKLRYIINNPSEYAQKLDEVKRTNHLSAIQSASSYHAICEKLITQSQTNTGKHDISEALSWAKSAISLSLLPFDNVPNWKKKYSRLEKHPIVGLMIKFSRILKRDRTF